MIKAINNQRWMFEDCFLDVLSAVRRLVIFTETGSVILKLVADVSGE